MDLDGIAAGDVMGDDFDFAAILGDGGCHSASERVAAKASDRLLVIL